MKYKNNYQLEEGVVPIDTTEEDAYVYEAEDKFLKIKIKAWLKNTSFLKFLNTIKASIIGQDELEIILANIYNYITNIVLDKPVNNNMILAAPSGCGKTETYRALRSYFKIHIPELPIAQIDITAITEEGFVGANTDLLTYPLFESNTSGYGIIFMDEFDKKLIPSYSSQGTNINAAIQNQLLTVIEGRNVEELCDGQLTGRSVDTSKTLFIGLGSFNCCRKDKNSVIGFEKDTVNNVHYSPVTRKDMIDMGASYEIIGRFPIVANYTQLEEKAIKKIINKITTRVSVSIGYDIVITSRGMNELAKIANQEYGCRLLESQIRSVIMPCYITILKKNLKRSQIVIDAVFSTNNISVYNLETLDANLKATIVSKKAASRTHES